MLQTNSRGGGGTNIFFEASLRSSNILVTFQNSLLLLHEELKEWGTILERRVQYGNHGMTVIEKFCKKDFLGYLLPWEKIIHIFCSEWPYLKIHIKVYTLNYYICFGIRNCYCYRWSLSAFDFLFPNILFFRDLSFVEHVKYHRANF